MGEETSARVHLPAETGVLRDVVDNHRLAVGGHPANHSLVHADPLLTEAGRARAVGDLKDQFAVSLVNEHEHRRARIYHAGGELHGVAQKLIQIKGGDHRLAHLVEQSQLAQSLLGQRQALNQISQVADSAHETAEYVLLGVAETPLRGEDQAQGADNRGLTEQGGIQQRLSGLRQAAESDRGQARSVHVTM